MPSSALWVGALCPLWQRLGPSKKIRVQPNPTAVNLSQLSAMRAFLTASFFLLAASLCAAADFTIVRVWPGYRPAESFERISEYFDKDEDVKGQHILRTHPDTRAGYYFLVRLKNETAEIPTARIELQLITPFSTAAKTYTFDSVIPKGNTAFNLGLTGADWPGQPKDEAVAWQVRLLSSTGAELAKAQSFLWAMPDKK